MRMPADGQAFTNRRGRIPAQIQMTGLHISVCARSTRVTHMLPKQRFSCMFKSWNAKSNTCQVRREWRRGRAVALTHMNHLRAMKYQDRPVRPGHGLLKYTALSSTCFHFLPCYICFSGEVKLHIGAKARFQCRPSNLVRRKRSYLSPPHAPSSSLAT